MRQSGSLVSRLRCRSRLTPSPGTWYQWKGRPASPSSSWSSRAGSLTALAKLNGKNYRKMLKTIAEQGADNVAVVLQGVLRPPATQGGTFVFEGAGFQVNIKTPRPAGQAPQ